MLANDVRGPSASSIRVLLLIVIGQQPFAPEFSHDALLTPCT